MGEMMDDGVAGDAGGPAVQWCRDAGGRGRESAARPGEPETVVVLVMMVERLLLPLLLVVLAERRLLLGETRPCLCLLLGNASSCARLSRQSRSEW